MALIAHASSSRDRSNQARQITWLGLAQSVQPARGLSICRRFVGLCRSRIARHGRRVRADGDLIERARSLEYHKIVLATFPHSAAALRLYERCGFRTVGDYKEQGLLDGKWTDTRIMELLL